jgi:hypothetical protein
MTAIPGTNVIAPIVPFSTTDEYPSHEAAYGRGGYRTVATTAARDAIPALRREAGMLVFVADTGKIWKLAADLSAWTELSSVSSWAELTGKPSVFPPASHTHVPADVGLGAVNNTADADKPVSTAQAAADAAVASAAAADATNKDNAAKAFAIQRANHTGTQLAATISDFSAAVVAAAPPTTNASLLTSGTLDAARLPASAVLTTDARLADARTPLAHNQAISTITGLQTALDAKATPSDVTAAVAAVVAASPASLDTLRELATALGDDANFSATVTNALAAKAPLASPTFTGTVGGITKSMVGLGSVDNTTDASKPVSTAQAAADTAVAAAAAADATSKAAAAQAAAVQRANHTGTQAASTITGLSAVATSNAYADLSGKPTLGTAASAASSDFAAASHTHPLSALTQSSATTGQVATWSGSAWAPATPSAGASSVATYAATSSFPATGSSSTIYLTAAGRLYRWVAADSVYAEIGTIGGIVDAVDGGAYA